MNLLSRAATGTAALLFLLIITAASSSAASGDTTVVVWKGQRLDSPHRVDVAHIRFPDTTKTYKKILMTCQLECPRLGCDPWDRTWNIWVVDPSAQRRADTSYYYYYFQTRRYELGRIITPYGKGWSWEIDVTDFRPLLTDSATILTYLSTFIGKGQGYLMTLSFRFIEGEPDFVPTDIRRLWDGNFEYGNPSDPIEQHLSPIRIATENRSDFAKVRVTACGYGQGNTDNAGEFARKRHELVVGSHSFSHYLWRDDCHRTPSGPQYGTWQESRAGFCPGDVVRSWENDISGLYSTGSSFTVDYNVEPYVNECRPGADPCPCEKCEYDGMGHTHPTLEIRGNAVFYRIPENKPDAAKLFAVASGTTPRTFTVTPSFRQPTEAEFFVLNTLGEVLYHRKQQVDTAPVALDLSMTPGLYQLKIITEKGVFRSRLDAR